MNVNVATVKNHLTMVNVHYVFLAKLDYLPILLEILHFGMTCPIVLTICLEYASYPVEQYSSTRI
jgi:hypothetical protein